MDAIINGKACYIYFPYFANNVVDIDFKHGGTHRVSSDLLMDMGYDIKLIPYGDQRQ